jgi:hypothetical protein
LASKKTAKPELFNMLAEVIFEGWWHGRLRMVSWEVPTVRALFPYK